MSKKTTPAPTPAAPLEIRLQQLDLRELHLRLVGDSPLVVHAWSAKAKAMMLARQMKEASPGKQAKNPVEDFRQTLYGMPGGKGYGFPAIGLKAAAVDAANSIELKKVTMRGAFHIPGELVKIEAPELTEPRTECDVQYWREIAPERKHGASMRSDMVRVGMGVADIRFRAQFVEWAMTLCIRYNHSAISPEQLVSLFNVAGFAVGVGEHRPQRDGSNGMWHVG